MTMDEQAILGKAKEHIEEVIGWAQAFYQAATDYLR